MEFERSLTQDAAGGTVFRSVILPSLVTPVGPLSSCIEMKLQFLVAVMFAARELVLSTPTSIPF